MRPPLPTGLTPLFTTAPVCKTLKGKGETGEPVVTVFPTGVLPEPVAVDLTNETPDRTATAGRMRAEEAARLAIMGEHAGTPEGVRLLMQHDPGHQHAHSVLAAVTR